jgi:hypothetical protein
MASAYENKPYKGHLSYEVEDGGIFFGRTREADQLVSKILGSRFTLVHAQSGAGKTSLLNARVIPGLEEKGWTVVVARPHFNPSLSLRVAALRQILPPPGTEATTLAQVREALFPDRDPALQELLDGFDLLELREDRRRSLLQPIDLESAEGTAKDTDRSIRPLLYRLLRATLEVKQYGEHLDALLDPDGLSERATLDPRASVSGLVDLLRQERLDKMHRDLTASLMRDGTRLSTFVSQLLSRYGRRRTQFGLVLVLDQFEEVFTRFTADPTADESRDAARQPSWKLRLDFFEELQELYQSSLSHPVHVVLSMRDEYIAQLDPLRRFVSGLDATTYHLTLLEKEQAHSSIREPARLFGYDYKDEVYQDIVEALLREDRFIDPSQLQIVCEKLWTDAGRQLALSERRADTEPILIGMEALPGGGCRQILKNFFPEYLAELDKADPTGAARLEALEILDSLVVAESGTRNIVEKSVIEHALFRNPVERGALLKHLASKRLIRLEPRLGGEFVEITHEFLIASILSHIAVELNGTTDYASFRWALRTLARYKDVDFRDPSNLLQPQVFRILNRSRAQLFIGESPAERTVPELMLRSAIASGADREAIVYWLGAFSAAQTVPSVDSILSQGRLNDPGRRLLSLYELAVVTEWARETQPTPEQAAYVLRTQLERATDRDRDLIAFWTQQVTQHEQRLTDR